MLVLAIVSLVGLDELPRWAEVPPAIAAVQGGFGLVMGWLLDDKQATHMGGGLTPGEMAFTIYGVAVLPPTALMISPGRPYAC